MTEKELQQSAAEAARMIDMLVGALYARGFTREEAIRLAAGAISGTCINFPILEAPSATALPATAH